MIRPVHPGDATGVADCVREVYVEYGFTWDPDGYHADLFDLSRFEHETAGRFWAAEEAGTIIGCGGIGRFAVIPGEVGTLVSYEGELRVAGTNCEVLRMYVRPSARGRGIGSAIMQNILDSAREWGCLGLEIWSDKRFTEAHRLYERFGAVVVGERICDDPDESPEWGMWVNLTS